MNLTHYVQLRCKALITNAEDKKALEMQSQMAVKPVLHKVKQIPYKILFSEFTMSFNLYSMDLF